MVDELILKQRLIAALARQRSQYDPSRAAVLGQIYGEPPADVEETDAPLWQQGLSAFAKPFEVITESLFKPAAAASLEPWRLAQQGNWKGAAAATLGNVLFPGALGMQALPYTGKVSEAIKEKTGVSPREQYEQWQAPKGVKFVAENIPWAFVPGATGAAAKLAPLGRGGMVAAQALRYSPWGLTERAIGAGVTRVVAAVKPHIPESVAKLTRVLKTAQKAQTEQTALRTEDLGKRALAAKEVLERGTGKQAFRDSMSELYGKYPKAEFVPPTVGTKAAGAAEDVVQLTEKDVTDLFEIIRNSKHDYFEKLHAYEGLVSVLEGGKIPQQHQLTVLQKIFGKDFTKAVLDQRSVGTKIWQGTMDVANAPRALLSSFDLSAPLRQGGVLAFRFPREWAGSLKPMLKAVVSDKNVQVVDDIIRQRPHFELGERMGLYTAPTPTTIIEKLSQREEMFMSQVAEMIPGVKISERAYVTFLNELRSRVWNSAVTQFEKQGANATDLKELAKYINWATGRGSLGPLGSNVGTLLNATLFSPRLLLSRIQLPTLLFSRSPQVRKLAIQNMMTFLGTGTALLSLAHMTGAGSVETDPKSADFAKLKVGDTRLDIWTGYVQYARFLAQFTTAERTTRSGRPQKLVRREVIDRFMQSKYSPAFGLINDLLKGETYMGESMELDTQNFKTQAFRRMTPLFIQDMIDAVEQEGPVGAAIAWPGAFGVGVVTYEDPLAKVRDKIATDKYGLTWDEVGKKYGKKVQNELEAANPEIQMALEDLQLSYARSYATDDTLWGDWAAFGRDVETS